MHPLVERLHEDNGNQLLIVQRHFPLPGHANAMPAAKAAEAAGRQGRFGDMSDLLFQNQAQWSSLSNPQNTFESYAQLLGLNLTQFRNDVADPAIETRILRDRDSATALNLPGTPSFFLNGQSIPNSTNLNDYQTLINAAIVESRNAEQATVTVEPIDARSARIRVLPDSGFAGQFKVRAAARDNFHGADAEAFSFQDITVTVAANQRPQAIDQLVAITGPSSVQLTLGGNDGDSAIDQLLTFMLDSLPALGTLKDLSGNPVATNVALASATLNFIPNANFAGTDQFRFHVRDDGGTGGGGQDTSTLATVSLRAQVNNTPTAQSQTVQLRLGQSKTFQLAGDDGDPDANQLLTYHVMTLPTNGTLRDHAGNLVVADTNLANSRLSYTPNGGYTGADAFTFVVKDDGGTAGGAQDTSAPATISFQIATDTPGPSSAPLLRHGILAIRGTREADTIDIVLNAEGDMLEVTVNDAAHEYELDQVKRLRIHAGKGDDEVTIGPDVEVPAHIFGGKGNDLITGGSAIDEIHAGRGDDEVDGGDGGDRIYGGVGDDNIKGGEGDDQIRGRRGNDTVDGEAGNDRVRGGLGADLVMGGDDLDRLMGGRGKDSLDGGLGADRLRGGWGHDINLDPDSLDTILDSLER